MTQPVPEKATAEQKPGMVREKAAVGIGEKGRGYGGDMITVPVKALWTAKEKIVSGPDPTMPWTSTRPQRRTRPEDARGVHGENHQSESPSITHVAGRTALRLRSRARRS